MDLHGAKSRTLSVNSLFTTFFLALFGWGLLQAWGISIKAGVSIHLLIAVPGLVLCGLTIYRYKHHWPDVVTGTMEAQKEKPLKNYRATVSLVIPMAVGLVLALVVEIGSLFLLILLIFGLICVPWTKLSLCRDHFFATVFLVEVCAALGVVFIGEPTISLYDVAAASLIMTIASITLLSIIIINGNRLDRMPLTGYSTDASSSSNLNRPGFCGGSIL